MCCHKEDGGAEGLPAPSPAPTDNRCPPRTSILPGRESPIKTGTSQESSPAHWIPQRQGPGYMKGGDLWLLSLHFRPKRPRCREGQLHKGLALRKTGWASREGEGPPPVGVELGTGRPKRGQGGGRGTEARANRTVLSSRQCGGRGPPTAVPEYYLCPWVLF